MNVTLSLFAGVGAQFFDNNGVPLSGGKIYTYAAGTTTPLATYTTASDSAFHTNPIILDSSGRVPGGGEIWINIGQGYKFILKTSADVLIATYDNVPSGAQPPAANDANSIMYEQGYTVNAGSFVVGSMYQIYSVGTTDFTLIGAISNNSGVYFIATGVGSGTGTAKLSQTVEQKLQQTISVLDFGADPTGTRSSVSAFQSAINATLNSGVESVFVPSGTYLGDMTTLTYGVRTGFVWEEAGGVTYSTAAPKSTAAQGVGLVVTRTNAKVTGSVLPTTVGQVGFEYTPIGLSGENPAISVTKNSTYTSGTSLNPSALLVTTNITSNTGTKDNVIIGIINDSSTSNVNKSRTALTGAGWKRNTNGSNFIVENITATDTTTRKSSVSTGALVCSEMDVISSGPDDVSLGVRNGLMVFGWESAPFC